MQPTRRLKTKSLRSNSRTLATVCMLVFALLAWAGGRGFRTQHLLDEHFAKHGGEFGGISESEYLRMAQSLRDAPVGGDVLEIVRPDDGVVSRFDKRSGAFLAFDRDGTIRTFFKPNDGERYFRRQATRPPSP